MGGTQHTRGVSQQALYRRYRSTSFDDVVGQEHITKLLKVAVRKGTIAHAYLFTGPRGTGKTSVARLLAYAVNNLPYTTDGNHLDIIEIDAASNRRIDDIRDLREKVHIAPVSAPYKVYIIDEVHMLTSESFNALLKTLEEPPAHALFILATTELHKVPATIVSRTQRFAFRPVARPKVVDHLRYIAQQEHIDIEPAALELIAEHGGGSFRDSISLLDQLGNMDQTISAAFVESVLGRAQRTHIDSLLDALARGDSATIAQQLNDLEAGGVSPVTLAEQLVRTILNDSTRSTEWYELADTLMNCTKAHFPQLMLTSTLLACSQRHHTSDTPKTPVNQPPSPTPTPTVVSTPPDTTPAVAVADPATPQPSTPTSPQAVDWQAVLEAAKKHEPTLYSILARATMSYDNTQLVLAFQYALHRKKLEQTQYRTQLARLIEDVCGACPDISIQSLDDQSTDNELTRRVADIMGGGDVVHV